MKLTKLFVSTAAALSMISAGAVYGSDADIYSIQFSEDGHHLITGGTGGELAGPRDEFSGGVKVWDADSGKLLQALGQSSDLESVFGTEYGRIGKRRWGINNFKDVVMSGNYPSGKVLVLPNSLGHMNEKDQVDVPSFVGATLDFAANPAERIQLGDAAGTSGQCGDNPYMYDYIGPVVPSDNGRYAAIVVNLCTAKTGAADSDQATTYQYVSNLHVMDLSDQKIIKTHNGIDAGVYALGISNDAERVAFVGRDQFAVLETADGERKVIEQYNDGAFMIPRQFSKLNFDETGGKLVSLRNIYDIDTGVETNLNWVDTDAKKPKRVSHVQIAPDLSYFVLVQKQRSLFMFGEDGLPRSYGKADQVLIWNTETGEETILPVTDSMSEGKRCVADVSPDSERVAIACKGGIVRLFNARSGEVIWSKKNVGYKNEAMGKHLIQAEAGSVEDLQYTLGLEEDFCFYVSKFKAFIH